MSHSMTVSDQTTLARVKAFLDQNAERGSKVLAKKVDGATVLYIGKPKSNPFDRLFGIARQRKALAKTTIIDRPSRRTRVSKLKFPAFTPFSRANCRGRRGTPGSRLRSMCR